jgi:mannose-6-phosphate isomerase
VQLETATYEPGHHFEWIWLLDRYCSRFGDDAQELNVRLASRAIAEGIDEGGAVIEKVGIPQPRAVQEPPLLGNLRGLEGDCHRLPR